MSTPLGAPCGLPGGQKQSPGGSPGLPPLTSAMNGGLATIAGVDDHQNQFEYGTQSIPSQNEGHLAGQPQNSIFRRRPERTTGLTKSHE